jgi:hypothetical protein
MSSTSRLPPNAMTTAKEIRGVHITIGGCLLRSGVGKTLLRLDRNGHRSGGGLSNHVEERGRRNRRRQQRGMAPLERATAC